LRKKVATPRFFPWNVGLSCGFSLKPNTMV
jgi:hypothetical protein